MASLTGLHGGREGHSLSRMVSADEAVSFRSESRTRASFPWLAISQSHAYGRAFSGRNGGKPPQKKDIASRPGWERMMDSRQDVRSDGTCWIGLRIVGQIRFRKRGQRTRMGKAKAWNGFKTRGVWSLNARWWALGPLLGRHDPAVKLESIIGHQAGSRGGSQMLCMRWDWNTKTSPSGMSLPMFKSISDGGLLLSPESRRVGDLESHQRV